MFIYAAAAARGGQVAGRGTGRNYFVAFCTLQMMQRTPHNSARQRWPRSSFSLPLSPFISLSLPPFPTPGIWKLVEGNISCCFLPPFFGLHAFLKVDCIRRGWRQLGMQLGIKQRRGAAQEVKNERKTKRETTWKAACFNFDIRTYQLWSVYYFLLLSASSCQDMITILKEDYIKRKNCSIYSGILWITDYLLWLFSNLITSSQITCFLSGLLLY